jgi:hypothetical protein
MPMTSEVADALLRGERWLSDRSPSARAICACSRSRAAGKVGGWLMSGR